MKAQTLVAKSMLSLSFSFWRASDTKPEIWNPKQGYRAAQTDQNEEKHCLCDLQLRAEADYIWFRKSTLGNLVFEICYLLIRVSEWHELI